LATLCLTACAPVDERQGSVGAALTDNHYYVSPGGSDSNDGSAAHPWATIKHADSVFTLGPDGAVIHVASGTYAAGIDLLRGGASPTVRLTIQCDAGVASAMAAIGQCRITGPIYGILVEANDVDIVGFDVGGDPSMNVALEGVCNATAAVPCPTGNSVHFIGNYVHDLAQNVKNQAGVLGCPENGAISVSSNRHGHTATDGRAIGNLVRNFGKGHPFPGVGFNGGCYTAQGIYPGASATGAIVENNIVINVPMGGITPSANCNNVITNNVVIGAFAGTIQSDLDQGVCPGGHAGNNTVANNYFADVDQSFFSTSGRSGQFCNGGLTSLYSHNMSDGVHPDFTPAPDACVAVTPASMTHQAPAAFFVDYQRSSGGDYHLRAGSLGIGGGATACAPGGITPCVADHDFENHPRTSPVDVGAYAYGLTSAPPAAALATGCKTSGVSFQSQGFATQAGAFRVELDATPSSSAIDGDIGLSHGAASAYADMGPIVEFHRDGTLLAMNGSTYQAATKIAYRGGIRYHLTFEVDLPSHTYSAFVTPPGGVQQAIAVDYTFRTTQASVASLDTLDFVSDAGTEDVCNLSEGSLAFPVQPGCLSSATTFRSESFPAQSGRFQLDLDATPSTSAIDGDIGLSFGAPLDYTSMGPIIEFHSDGTILAMNGRRYEAQAIVPYLGGKTYHLRMVVDLVTHTYSAYATPPGGLPQAIGQGFTFRATQAATEGIDTFDFVADVGSQNVCNVTMTPMP
jgi:hypothetical protein